MMSFLICDLFVCGFRKLHKSRSELSSDRTCLSRSVLKSIGFYCPDSLLLCFIGNFFRGCRSSLQQIRLFSLSTQLFDFFCSGPCGTYFFVKMK